MKKFWAFLLLILLLLMLLLLMLLPQKNPRIRLQSQAFINQPVLQVWEKLSDLSQLQSYLLFVDDSEVTKLQKKGEGTQRTIYLKNKHNVQEEVIEWDQGQGFVLRLHKPSFFLPFHDVETRYRIESDDEAGLRTDLAVTLTVRPRFGLLGRWLLAPFMTTRFQRLLDDLADGLKYYCETGLPVTEQTVTTFRQ
ncbi:hypothetical protein GZ77_23910 [Endozoicomonas montiporae]|uniref:Polyketide cyclase n=2 Tax=Endozoicomonas montiporae TaxID=1027273 RepID=A0A081MZE8_9GAMM|nr:SRPBCC family protein [Endozoicomonas montiporae]AMO54746.1 hypothetical protein EZMO1_0495 [Endozoicomonas montiporae CL-33]KEQ11571.1 hypothetical protein GZ77_23910 [Endozoicomonas montiporae]